MILVNVHVLLILVAVASSYTPDAVPSEAVKQIANITYGAENPSSLTSIFSPRMDFEQWKPLTGRGDPLRNDPTYDYEPPVLERVHYWADDTRLEREHYPERKSEVLMLGVSSRKPSVTPRQPPVPPRRNIHRPPPAKYEDYTYKLNEHYPMTILVPPPPPPPGHKPPLFVLPDEENSGPNKVQAPTKLPSAAPNHVTLEPTAIPEHLTSLFALQEANLIYQSSTTIHDWTNSFNETKPIESNLVSSDYAGWGPTTPMDDYEVVNETHNLILNEQFKKHKHPYSFYKPMLSEQPPPPKVLSPLVVSTFVPTVLPPIQSPEPTTMPITQMTWQTEQATVEVSTEPPQEITTERTTTSDFRPTPFTTVKPKSEVVTTMKPKPELNLFDMLGPMMSMPMVNGPERLEDNLYAHASENIHVFNDQKNEDIQIETMQTMQPPPPTRHTDNTKMAHKQQFHVNSDIHNRKPILYTHGPYLHMRFTTPIPTTVEEITDNLRSTTEAAVPYLIIQGHSKVKTYGSKPKAIENNDTISNEIPKPFETNEVKHLHPIKEKLAKKADLTDDNRKGRAQNLKALIDKGVGSIEIQEADVGIKYDVSDGSDVPVEIYRKGIVDSDENGYISSKTKTQQKKSKRQIDLEDLIPFDEDTIDEYVYNFLEGKKNETGFTGLLAQAVTSNEAVDEVASELEDDDDDSGKEEER